MSTNTADIGSNGKGIIAASGKLQVGGCCCGDCPGSVQLTISGTSAICDACQSAQTTGDPSFLLYRAINIDGTYLLSRNSQPDNFGRWIYSYSETVDFATYSQWTGPNCAGSPYFDHYILNVFGMTVRCDPASPNIAMIRCNSSPAIIFEEDAPWGVSTPNSHGCENVVGTFFCYPSIAITADKVN